VEVRGRSPARRTPAARWRSPTWTTRARPEIIFGKAVYDNAGKLLWEGANAGGQGINGQGPISCIADLDADGRPELIGGRTAYKTTGTVGGDFTGTVMWNGPATDGFCGVADFNEDGAPEVVLVATSPIPYACRDTALRGRILRLCTFGQGPIEAASLARICLDTRRVGGRSMINAAFVRECKARAKMYEVTCDALPGFILRVLPTGKKVALVRYRVAGKDHRERIGLLGPTLSIDEARRRAAIMLANVAAGEGDGATTSATTAGTRAPVKQVEPARSQIETLRSLAERFIRVHVDVRLKPGTAERYRQNIRDVILPYKEIEDKPTEDNERASRRRTSRRSASGTSAASSGPRSTRCTPR
jgi:hypothetical protein